MSYRHLVSPILNFDLHRIINRERIPLSSATSRCSNIWDTQGESLWRNSRKPVHLLTIVFTILGAIKSLALLE